MWTKVDKGVSGLDFYVDVRICCKRKNGKEEYLYSTIYTMQSQLN